MGILKELFSGGSTSDVLRIDYARAQPQPPAEREPVSKAFDDLETKGFTGTITASNGVVYHYVDGKRVAGHEYQGHIDSGNPAGAKGPKIGKDAAKQAVEAVHHQLQSGATIDHDALAKMHEHIAAMDVHELRAFAKHIGATIPQNKGHLVQSVHDKLAEIAGHKSEAAPSAGVLALGKKLADPGKLTAEEIKNLPDALAKLNIGELQAIKKQLGVSGVATKPEIIEAIKAKLGGEQAAQSLGLKDPEDKKPKENPEGQAKPKIANQDELKEAVKQAMLATSTGLHELELTSDPAWGLIQEHLKQYYSNGEHFSEHTLQAALPVEEPNPKKLQKEQKIAAAAAELDEALKQSIKEGSFNHDWGKLTQPIKDKYGLSDIGPCFKKLSKENGFQAMADYANHLQKQQQEANPSASFDPTDTNQIKQAVEAAAANLDIKLKPGKQYSAGAIGDLKDKVLEKTGVSLTEEQIKQAIGHTEPAATTPTEAVKQHFSNILNDQDGMSVKQFMEMWDPHTANYEQLAANESLQKIMPGITAQQVETGMHDLAKQLGVHKAPHQIGDKLTLPAGTTIGGYKQAKDKEVEVLHVELDESGKPEQYKIGWTDAKGEKKTKWLMPSEMANLKPINQLGTTTQAQAQSPSKAPPPPPASAPPASTAHKAPAASDPNVPADAKPPSANFSGTVTGTNGAVFHFVNGKHVPGPNDSPTGEQHSTSVDGLPVIKGNANGYTPASFDVNQKPPVDYTGKGPAQIAGWAEMDSIPLDKQAYGAVLMRTDPKTGKTQVLLREPTGHFDGYVWTFPKGKRDEAKLSPADVAHKELAEETGYGGHVVGHIEKTFATQGVTKNAFFIMKHDGQDHDPSKMDKETANVQWVDLDKAHELINQTTKTTGKARDLAILEEAKKFSASSPDPKIAQKVDQVNGLVEQMHQQGDFDPKSLHGKLKGILGDLSPAGMAQAMGALNAGGPKNLLQTLNEQLQARKGKAYFPSDANQLKTVQTLGGSTGAELKQDAAGNQFVVKHGKSAGHIQSEMAADKAYQALGIAVPQFQQVNTPDGPAKVAAYLPGATPLSELKGEARQKAFDQLKQNFAADALLANHDVVGLNMDNVLVDQHGLAWRIDNGGSLEYRAQGKKKGTGGTSPFGEEVFELDTMRDPNVNPNCAKVYAGLTEQDIANQVHGLVAKKKELFAALPEGVRETVQKRLKWMAQKYGVKYSDPMVISGSAYVGDATPWKDVAPNAGVSYAPKAGEQNHSLFKQYGDDETRKGTTADQLPKSFMEHTKKTIASMTPGEKTEAKSYTGSAYHSINTAMRECPETLDCLDSATRKRVDAISSALAKAGVMEKPITVWRKIHLSGSEHTEFMKAMKHALDSGETMRMPGFKSTSVNTGVWSGNVCFEIKARTGMYVKPISNYASEEEFLQGHNVRYRVAGIKDVSLGGSKKQVVQLEEIV